MSIKIKINKYLTGLTVKGSTSKSSWLVNTPSLNTINDTVKCEDDISLTYQSADSSQSNANPPPPPGGGLLCFKL